MKKLIPILFFIISICAFTQSTNAQEVIEICNGENIELPMPPMGVPLSNSCGGPYGDGNITITTNDGVEVEGMVSPNVTTSYTITRSHPSYTMSNTLPCGVGSTGGGPAGLVNNCYFTSPSIEVTVVVNDCIEPPIDNSTTPDNLEGLFQIVIESCPGEMIEAPAPISNLVCGQFAVSFEYTVTPLIDGVEQTEETTSTLSIESPNETTSYIVARHYFDENGESICPFNGYLLIIEVDENSSNCIEEDETLINNSDYPWLSDLVDGEDCCEVGIIQEFYSGPYAYLYLSPADACDGYGVLYNSEGQLYCTSGPDFDCVSLYGLSNLSVLWSCDGGPTPPEPPTPSEEINIPDYPWITESTDCEIYEYSSGPYSYVVIDGVMYSESGQLYCTSAPNFDCVSLYGLSNQTLIWSCEDDPEPPTPPTPCTYENTGTVFFAPCDNQTYYFIEMADGTIYDPYVAEGETFPYTEGEIVAFSYEVSNFTSPCSGALAVDLVCIQSLAEPTVPTDYTWLSSVVDANDCCNSSSVYEYMVNGYAYILVVGEAGCNEHGVLYNDSGLLYCTSAENYDCVSLYGLSNPTLIWSCGDEVSPPEECDCTDEVFAPVCGDDGEVYDNVCEAVCAGITYSDCDQTYDFVYEICSGEELELEGNGNAFLPIDCSGAPGANGPLPSWEDDEGLYIGGIDCSVNGPCTITVNPDSTTVYTHGYTVTICIDHVYYEKTYLVIVNEDCEGKSGGANIDEQKVIIEASVYPNPSQGLFNVDMAGVSNEAILTIFHLNGQQILSKPAIQTSQLDLTNYPKGIYIMRIIDGDAMITKKLMIK